MLDAPPMSTINSTRWCALGLAALAACSGSKNSADPFYGAIDNTFGVPPNSAPGVGALDAKFQPIVTTPSTRVLCFGLGNSCYVQQQGFVNGQFFNFFNTGTITPSSNVPTTTLPDGRVGYPATLADHNKADGSGGWHADSFPHSCTPRARGFDPRDDAYRVDIQYPVADALPIANTAVSGAKQVLPIVAVYGVTGVQGETCNDIKNSLSIASATDPESGAFGARRSLTPLDYEVWAVFDPTVPVLTASGTPITADFFWFRGLLANYFSGGPIPLGPDGSLVAMDGIILDPAVGTTFEKSTTNKALLFSYKPGDVGYSPIARLHDFRLPAGKKLGDYTGICQVGAVCKPTEVKLSDAGNVFNTIFIVSSAQ